jgi:hypothetical protein
MITAAPAAYARTLVLIVIVSAFHRTIAAGGDQRSQATPHQCLPDMMRSANPNAQVRLSPHADE